MMEIYSYVDGILGTLSELTAIHSPTGYTKDAADYVLHTLEQLGYAPEQTRKGGVLCCLGGPEGSEGLLLSAHVDTLGGMVAEVKANGRLRLASGGFANPNTEAENVTIITREGKRYEGTYQLNNASIHVNKDYRTEKRDSTTMEVVIDEAVSSKESTLALGIQPGDIVCFDPRTRVTASGYIKSRFLDDKLSAAILLGYARYLKEEGVSLSRRVYLHFTVYEECGHGGSGSVPADVTEMLAVDMGCVGEGLLCDERMVSICARDSAGPYHYDMTTRLIQLAKENGLNYAVDVYPNYGSDADAAVSAGNDLRHALIGPGVYASHGYERSHRDGAENTFRLLCLYAV